MIDNHYLKYKIFKNFENVFVFDCSENIIKNKKIRKNSLITLESSLIIFIKKKIAIINTLTLKKFIFAQFSVFKKKKLNRSIKCKFIKFAKQNFVIIKKKVVKIFNITLVMSGIFNFNNNHNIFLKIQNVTINNKKIQIVVSIRKKYNMFSLNNNNKLIITKTNKNALKIAAKLNKIIISKTINHKRICY